MTDVMSVFALVSQALRTGEPLHQILPSSLTERMLYHQTHKELAMTAAAVSSRINSHINQMHGVTDNGEMTKDTKMERDGSTTDDPAERIQHLEFMYYAMGISAVTQLITVSYSILSFFSSFSHCLKCLDELHRTTKRLCGEVPFRGFEEWRKEYERVYESKL